MEVDSSPAPSSTTMDRRLDAAHALLGAAAVESTTVVLEPVEAPVVTRRPRSGSVGLDELAELAAGRVETTMTTTTTAAATSNSVSSSSSSSDDDYEAMPPPPPRPRRQRSCSNPEGMEKWRGGEDCGGRQHLLILPSAILEEELAEASALAKAHQEQYKHLPFKKRTREDMEEVDEYGTSPDSVMTSPIMTKVSENNPYLDDQADVEPEELLRRARSRLLEDLSEGSLKGEKGVVMLPHSLSKYKETYNKNGRIGIYTPAERAAIIARFQSKRSRRVWNKKIRYGCRKNLADRRMRVKGRFVKRSPGATREDELPVDTSLLTPEVEMPDVNDPEAGFVPTKDQPFRRRRRHTIT